MTTAYRVGRAALAGGAILALALLAGWHVLVWRMGEVYKADSRVSAPPERMRP